MINSSTFLNARINKRHNILSFHYVRAMIARGFIAMHHVVSNSNVADIVTKHWGHSSVYTLLKPISGHEGDTDELYEDDCPEALAEQYEESE